MDVPPARIGFGTNCFAIDGGSTAVSDAVATLVVLVPDSAVDNKPLTLVCGPAVVATILTLAVHEPLAGKVAPVVCPYDSVVAPAVGAQDGAPPQVVAAAGVAATW